MFDPAAYLNVEITEPTVKRPPLPIGDYMAVIGAVKAEAWSGKPGGPGEGKSGIRWVVPLTIEVPPGIQADLKLTQSTIVLSDSIMLDLTEGGLIDNSAGKNGKMRRYREALDMNKPGDSFGPKRMEGRPVRVKLTHELYQGDTQERIDAVARP